MFSLRDCVLLPLELCDVVYQGGSVLLLCVCLKVTQYSEFLVHFPVKESGLEGIDGSTRVDPHGSVDEGGVGLVGEFVLDLGSDGC